ncbi:MAG TPA: hypothetical protein VGN07_17020 [Steroidobacteraceae bacterium]
MSTDMSNGMSIGKALLRKVPGLRTPGMKFPCKTLCCCLPALAMLLGASGAVAETRGYAISLIYTASYSDAENCPKGGNGGTSEMKQRILLSRGYTKEQAFKIIAANDVDDKGQKIEFKMRGVMDGHPADVADFPMSYPDPHIETVQGRLAYGFNLDGQAGPNSFEDPQTHEKGVDNQMWRVLGCFANYQVRPPVIPYNESIVWDTAMDSMPAWLVSIAGGDLNKDGEVTVTFDRALNVLMRDAHGAVLPGSSYTIDRDPRSHSVFKGHIKDQVVSIEPGNFFMQGESQFYAVLRFTHTQLRLKLNPSGTLSGLIGGYQPWLDYYHYLSIRGEGDGLVDLPGTYYAMKRLADADPDPATGENRAISSAYYIEAAPVFLTSVAGQVVSTAYAGDGSSQAPVVKEGVAKEDTVARQDAPARPAPR